MHFVVKEQWHGCVRNRLLLTTQNDCINHWVRSLLLNEAFKSFLECLKIMSRNEVMLI